MSTRDWVIALSIVGSLLEGVGILLVADRVTDLRLWVRATVRRARRRVREGHERLARLFPVRQFAIRGLARVMSVSGRITASAKISGNVSASRTLGGTHDEQIQRLTNELDALGQRVDDLEQGLDARIRAGAKDAVPGLVLLVLGLLCLLFANIVGVW